MSKYTILIISFLSLSSVLLAQGVGWPDEPSQAPIGGLELLIGAGGAMAWKKLKNRKK
jgi:hypothetical protein